MDVRYRLKDISGRVIFCNLTEKEISLTQQLSSKSQKMEGGNLRGGVLNNEKFLVYAFSSNKDYLKSSQKFKTELEVIFNSTRLIDEIIEIANQSINKSTSRLIHNLTTLNAHNMQEIHSLIPQENVRKNMGDQISYVEKIVRAEPKETALALLRIAKNNAAMKVEFSVFKKLFDSNPELQKKEHNVHKVLMNVFYLFFPDFTDKNVKVIVGDISNKYTAFFDYESLHVALYHLVENAAKYTKPNTTFKVSINNNHNLSEIIMDMISIEIKQTEKIRYLKKGFVVILQIR